MRALQAGLRGGRVPTVLLIAIVFIAACAQSTAAGWPFDIGFSQGQTFWWLQILSLAALVATVSLADTPRHAAWQAWGFATTWLSSTFWWLFVAMNTYGGLPAVLAAFAVIALAAALGAYYALAIWAWRRYFPPTSGLSAPALAALWLMAEMARGTWLTGFGWGAIGYAHVDGPLAVYLPWVGSYGVSALAAGITDCP